MIRSTFSWGGVSRPPGPVGGPGRWSPPRSDKGHLGRSPGTGLPERWTVGGLFGRATLLQMLVLGGTWSPELTVTLAAVGGSFWTVGGLVGLGILHQKTFGDAPADFLYGKKVMALYVKSRFPCKKGCAQG